MSRPPSDSGGVGMDGVQRKSFSVNMFERLTRNSSGPPERVAPAYPMALEGAHPDYPFENAVFQGGGAKGIIYGGCISALDDLGILPYIKRVAGASAGCAAALLIALGLNGDQAEVETDEINMHEFLDGGKNAPCGNLCKRAVLMCNIYTKLGMHPAEALLTHFSKLLEKYTGDPDLTFKGLYNLSGRELCIAVSNVSRHQAELCHVNTTPHMPIRMAIRASMSLPILMEPCMLAEGETYVDGGLFNNFPLKAFDGWFLSTVGGDDILTKTHKNNPDLFNSKARPAPQPDQLLREYQEVMCTSFQEPNPATIGFRVTNDESPDDAAYAGWVKNMESKIRLERNVKASGTEEQEVKHELKLPDTRLANAYSKKKESASAKIECVFKYEMAYASLLNWMVCHVDVLLAQPVHGLPHAMYCHILIKQLKKTPPPDCSYSLFGFYSWDEFAAALDGGKKGYITRPDVSKFWEKWGVRNAFHNNRKPKSINTPTLLVGEMMESIFTVMEESLLRDPSNASRVCGLNTKYVGVLDFDLEQEDKEFLYDLGRRDTTAWIKNKVSEMGNRGDVVNLENRLSDLSDVESERLSVLAGPGGLDARYMFLERQDKQRSLGFFS